jgi:acetyltransferase-like isoleucine patch superfamily enzyme
MKTRHMSGIKHYILKFLMLITSDPIKLAKLWRISGVNIGTNTYVYRNVTFGNGGLDPITIGNNCVLTGCTILGHDASTNKRLGLQPGEWSMQKPVTIDDDCFIGIGSIILMGVRVGKGSIVAAGAVITKDVPPNSVVGGNPAKIICSVDELVEKRRQLALIHPEYFPDKPRI